MFAQFALLLGLCGSVQQSEWERDPAPLLTNFINMYQPCVVEVGGDWRYKMWFFGWKSGPGADSIYHARSKDLKHWQVYCADGTWDSAMDSKLWGPVVSSSDRWFDNWHNGDPSVVVKDGKFLMAYSSASAPLPTPVDGYPNGMILDIMGATSDDGIHWTKTAQPLLIRPGDVAAPKPEPNRIGDFNRPCLRWEAGRWKLWFDYWIPGKGCCLGYAENPGEFRNTGGFRLKYALDKPQLDNWVNPEVIKIDGVYHLFGDPPGYPTKPGLDATAVGWMSREICEATSKDGVHWTRLGFIPPDKDADACHVPQALVTEIDGQRWLYLFYSTQTGFKRGDGVYHFEYDRLRAMRRKLGPVDHK